MTADDLIANLDLTSTQRYEMIEAFEESPDGFARLVRKSATANNPQAALISMVRKGQHTRTLGVVKGSKPEATTLDDVVDIAIRSYNARKAKYPDFPGDDAIGYATWVASTWNSRLSPDAIERGLRRRIGKAWTAESDPAERERVLRAVPPMREPERAPTRSDLAQRLLATLGA